MYFLVKRNHTYAINQGAICKFCDLSLYDGLVNSPIYKLNPSLSYGKVPLYHK